MRDTASGQMRPKHPSEFFMRLPACNAQIFGQRIAVLCCKFACARQGFSKGFLSGVDITAEMLANEGYVKHTRLENGELKLKKLNEDL